MANIPIRDIPGGVVANPSATDRIAIDNGTAMQQTTLFNAVNACVPVATQSEAEAGTGNSDRMTALRTKQSIASEVGVNLASKAQGDRADTAVQPARQIISGAGLTGGGDLSSDRTLAVGAGTGITVNDDDVALSAASIASLALANTSVQPTRQIIAGSGLTGGGTLSGDVTINVGSGAGISVSADAVSLDATTQLRLLPSGGTLGQALVKASGTDYDTAWSSAGAGDMIKAVYDPASVEENVFNGYPVASRTELKAVDTTLFTTVYLTEAGREGQFIWRSGDYSAQIAADTQEGVYVKGDGIDASVGAWVRQGSWLFDGVLDQWFGVEVGASSDQSVKMNAAIRFAETYGLNVKCRRGRYRFDNRIFIYKRCAVTGPEGNGAIHVVGGYNPECVWDFSNLTSGNAVVLNGTNTLAEGITLRDIDIIRSTAPAKGSGINGLAVIGVTFANIVRVGINKFDTLLVMKSAADNGGTDTRPNTDCNFEDLRLRESMTACLDMNSSININFIRGQYGSNFTKPDRICIIRSGGSRTCDTVTFSDVIFINNSLASGLALPPELIRVQDGFLLKFIGCVFEQSTGAAVVIARAADEVNPHVIGLLFEACHFNGVANTVLLSGGRTNIIMDKCRGETTGVCVTINTPSVAQSATKIRDCIFHTSTDMPCVQIENTKGVHVSGCSLTVGGSASQPAVLVGSGSVYNKVIFNDTHTNYTANEGVANFGGATNVLTGNTRF